MNPMINAIRTAIRVNKRNIGKRKQQELIVEKTATARAQVCFVCKHIQYTTH